MRSSLVRRISDSRLGRLFALAGLLSALVLTIAPVAGVGAQTSQVKIKDLQIQVWPEYDEPRVLVIYLGNLPDDVTLPQQMTFWLPANISLNSTCSVRPDGTHNNETAQAKLENVDGGTKVTYPVVEKQFHIEFYYNPIQVTGADKSFVYNFQTLNTIDSLSLEIQQPLKSTNFKLDPSAPASAPDDRGFKYYTFNYTNVTPEQKPLAMNVSYTRPDSNPSIVKGSDSTSATGSGSTMDPKMLMLFVGVLVAAIGGYFVYSRSHNNQPRRAPASYRGSRPGGGKAGGNMAASRAAKPNGGGPKAAAKRPAGGGGFCGSCGTPLSKDDRFCPSCGKKSRLAAGVGDLEG